METECKVAGQIFFFPAWRRRRFDFSFSELALEFPFSELALEYGHEPCPCTVFFWLLRDVVPGRGAQRLNKCVMKLNKFREPLIKEMLEQSTVTHPMRLATALTGRRGTAMTVVA